MNSQTNEFTAQDLDKFISLVYPSIPDPEIVLYTGVSCCTHGFLPWQIRLTEFIQLSLDHSVNIGSYVGAMYKYSKCDQRFGKWLLLSLGMLSNISKCWGEDLKCFLQSKC